jgi:hypothetical protein
MILCSTYITLISVRSLRRRLPNWRIRGPVKQPQLRRPTQIDAGQPIRLVRQTDRVQRAARTLDHTAYLRRWLNVLKEDKRAIFSAAAHAQRDETAGNQNPKARRCCAISATINLRT